MNKHTGKIKELRIKRGLTQAEAAKAMGISTKTVYRYERQKVKRPQNETMVILASFYGVELMHIWEEYGYEK